MTEPEKEWRPIPGFDGKYEITRAGEVRSWKPWCRQPLPRAMTVQNTRSGRKIQLGLYGGTHAISSLVELAFTTPDPSVPVAESVDTGDGCDHG